MGNYATGNIILIGEQAANPTEATPNQQAFCSSRGCSGWLNWLLEEEGIPEERLFWLNAKNNDGTDVELWPILKMGPCLIISLGGVARLYCEINGLYKAKEAYGVDARYEPQTHPQYWKRFKHKERYPLLDLLRENILNRDGRLESRSRINTQVSTERCCPCHNSTAITVIKETSWPSTSRS